MSMRQSKEGIWSPLTTKILNIAIGVIAGAMALYHLLYTQVLLFDAIQHQNFHLFFALTLIYLFAIKNLRQKKLLPISITLLLVSIACTVYVAYFYAELQLRPGYQTTPDVIIGTLLILVVLVACWKSFGPVLPILAILFFLYAWFGHLLPGFLHHFPQKYPRVISQTVMGFQSGLYGVALAVSANYIFLFVLFGGMIQVSGAPKLFMEIGKLVGRKLKGGPAQTAVISSCLVGSVTGASMANVAVTGAFTIPLMKRVGYQPYQAGAIEAAASTGGQILPPIMGATAFLIVGIIGIQYIQLVAAAAIPGILYFIAVGLYCEFQARKQDISVTVETVDFKLLLATLPIFVVPFTLLLVLLIRGHSPMFCIFWAIIATAILGFLIPQARPRLKEWLNGLQGGVISGARIASACATIGVVMGVMLVTGLGLKLSAQLEVWSMGSLWLAAIITALMCIIMGMGLPPLAAYLMVAILAAPVFLNWNVPLLQSHLFIFYFAVFSVLTPPVALAGLVASQLAGSGYFKTSIEAFKIALPGFLMPFVFLVNPSLLGRPPSLLVGALTLIAIVLALAGLAALATGYYLVRVNRRERLLLVVCTAALIGYCINFTQFLFFLVGVGLFAVITFWQWKELSAKKRETPEHALDAASGE